MSKNILITGGEGFIGSRLARKLLSAGHRVVLYGRKTPSWSHPLPDEKNLVIVHADLTESNSLEKALEGVELVFHKASAYSNAGKKNDAWLEYSNISGTAALVRALKKSGSCVQKIILDSSISVYGEGRYHCANCADVRPLTRTLQIVQQRDSFEPPCPICGAQIEPTFTRETDDLNGSSAYACSKKMQERLMKEASVELGFALTVFRYATVYGGKQRSNNQYSRFIDAIFKNGLVVINEDGYQKRDFVHVDDVVAANEIAMNQNSGGCKALNFGTGSETSLLDFITELRARAQIQLNRSPGEIKITSKLVAGDIRHCKLDCTLARTTLDFVPLTSWRDGVKLWLLECMKSAPSEV